MRTLKGRNKKFWKCAENWQKHFKLSLAEG